MMEVDVEMYEDRTGNVTSDVLQDYVTYLEDFSVPVKRVYQDGKTVTTVLRGDEIGFGDVDRIGEGFEIHVEEIPTPKVDHIGIGVAD